jgi:transcriptional regulator GlxA family with amidase domain
MDVLGTHTVLGITPGAEIHLVWKDIEPFEGVPRWPMRATTSFADCPDVDVLMVGAIPPEVIGDLEVLSFFRRKAESAKAVIAVCGGALLAGAAGLLRDRRATTNFQMLDALQDLGAEPVPGGRVVVDGKFYTAGPVTGSFEAALLVLAALRGEEMAKFVELTIEFDPHPPFGVGSPDLAGPERTAQSVAMFKELSDLSRATARSAYLSTT